MSSRTRFLFFAGTVTGIRKERTFDHRTFAAGAVAGGAANDGATALQARAKPSPRATSRLARPLGIPPPSPRSGPTNHAATRPDRNAPILHPRFPGPSG